MSDSEECEEFEIENLKPRAYQLDLLRLATEANIIAFLDTGTGKTLIALMLMKETNGKCIFLAPVRILVKQQSTAASMMGIPNTVIIGDSADKWEYYEWQAALSKVQSLFMTPELLLNCLRAGYLNLEQFKLIVFDECHHCAGNHPYMKIMLEFYHCLTTRPKVLGLTASPIGHSNTSHLSLRNDLQDLCTYLDSAFVPIDRDQVREVANDPQFVVVPISPSKEIDLGFIMGLVTRLPGSSDGIAVSELLQGNGADIAKLIGKRALMLMVHDVIRRINDENTIELLNNFHIDGEFSNRFDKLIEILVQHFSESGGQVIILAQKRITAWYLAESINYVNSIRSLNIIAEKLVGKMNRKVEIGLLKISDIKQKEVVEDFKAEKFNVLVSTTVAEEGLDIPSCDLVIRYDSMSHNLRSYVQSKGRARDQDSKFMIFTEKGKEGEVSKDLEKFDETLKFLKDLANNRITPKGNIKPLPCYEVPSEDLSIYRDFNSEFSQSIRGAKVSSNWSLEFMENFCKSLNKDSYDKHKVSFIIKHFRPSECNMKVTNSGRGGYLAILNFPKILSIGDVHSASLHNTDIRAKEDSAIQAAKFLYEKGYLNKHLRPIWNARPNKVNINLDDPDIELVDEKGMKLRPKAKFLDSKQTTLLPQDLCIYNITASTNSEYFVYNIASCPVYPRDSEYSMGVIIGVKLDISPFVMYPYNLFRYSGIEQHTEKHLNCRNCEKYPFQIIPELVAVKKFEESELKAIKTFHFIINAACKGKYRGLINAYGEKPQGFKSSEIPVCFVPIKSGKIDFKVINETIEFFNNDYKGVLNKPLEAYPGCIIKSKHLKDFYIYLREVPDGAHYEFEDKHFITSLRYYYLNKYGIQLNSNKIIEVKPLGNFRQGIRPRTLADHSGETLYLPIDQCEVHPIPPEIFLWCRLSPNVFHKLNQSFLTSALRFLINLPISHELLIEAITCGSSLEGIDYQRLEILGDSILKFTISEYLYHSMPSAFEGLLTQKRMDLTSNDNLFKKGVDLKIYKFMQAKVFNAKHWKPQGLEKVLEVNDDEDSDEEEGEDLEEFFDEVGWDKILEEKGEVRIEPRKEEVELSNKQIADCMEALIGAAYRSGGIHQVLDLLRVFQIIDSVWPDEVSTSLPSRNYAELEKRLGYEFNNSGVLEEALTHNTALKSFNYNRLEFLGDALIDFIVLEHLYLKFPMAGPGSLSKIKSTAVSNRTFSYISYELALHDFLIYSGSEIRSDIMTFKSNISKLGGLENINKLPDFGIKLMGDLFESTIAAIYIDSKDLNFCKQLVLKLLHPLIEGLSPDNCNLHPHNKLFDFAQRNKKQFGSIKIERFKLESRSGVEFVTKIYIQEQVVVEGRGPSKLSSSEIAAENFFAKIGNR